MVSGIYIWNPFNWEVVEAVMTPPKPLKLPNVIKSIKAYQSAMLENLAFIPYENSGGFFDLSFAFPIATQMTSARQVPCHKGVFIAGAFGKGLRFGRVVIMSSPKYWEKHTDPDYEKLLKQLVNWLSHGETRDLQKTIEVKGATYSTGVHVQRPIYRWTPEASSAGDIERKMLIEVIKGAGLLVFLNFQDTTSIERLSLLQELTGIYFETEDKEKNKFEFMTQTRVKQRVESYKSNYILLEYMAENSDFFDKSPFPLDETDLTTKCKSELSIRKKSFYSLLVNKAICTNMGFISFTPCSTKPACGIENKRVSYYNNLVQLIQHRVLPHCLNQFKIAGVYPGIIPNLQQNTKSYRLQIYKIANKEFNEEILSTGLYAAPMQKIRVKIIKRGPEGYYFSPAKHRISIGGNFAQLDTGKLSCLKKWPRTEKLFSLTEDTEFYIFSPFGGIIWILYNYGNQEAYDFDIEFHGVIEAPYYDFSHNDESQQYYNKIESSVAPWGEINVGDLIFGVPKHGFKNFGSNTVKAVEKYERCVRLSSYLRGVMDGGNWELQPPERFQADVQIQIGYMHSGYPIRSHLDVVQSSTRSYLDYDYITSGDRSFGILHELGHNYSPFAAFAKTGVEVDANYYGQLLNNLEFGIPLLTGSLFSETSLCMSLAALGQDAPAETSDLNLIPILQLVESIGPEVLFSVLKHVLFSGYGPARERLARLQQTMKVVSLAVNYNVQPIFDFVNFKYNTTGTDVGRLVPFLPEDAATSCLPHKVRQLEQMYPNLQRKMDSKVKEKFRLAVSKEYMETKPDRLHSLTRI